MRIRSVAPVLRAARGSAWEQTRRYHPYGEPVPPFDFQTERKKWESPSAAVGGLAELYERINGPLSECEDIMSSWRDTKWHGREVSPELRRSCDDFLARKYDRGEEVGFLERLMLQYRLIATGRFEGAFTGYFRTNNEGVTVFDQEDRWGELKRLLFTNVPVMDDLHDFLGYSEDGYRSALGRMLTRSLHFRLPSGRESGVYSKIMFEHVVRGDSGEDPVLHVLASYQEEEAIDFFFLHPNPQKQGHKITLVCIGSENKYKRRTQVPSREVRAKVGSRCERVFGLPEGSVETDYLLTPPMCLSRGALQRCDVVVGGLAAPYAQWLPYYPVSEAEASLDVDWKHQEKKQQEDEFYQL